jgi:hypothetical protein
MLEAQKGDKIHEDIVDLKGIRRHFKEELRRGWSSHMKMIEFDKEREEGRGGMKGEWYNALRVFDIFRPIYIWQKIEATARDIFRLRLSGISAPIIESTDVFIRHRRNHRHCREGDVHVQR